MGPEGSLLDVRFEVFIAMKIEVVFWVVKME
jgi:hypothetical protein